MRLVGHDSCSRTITLFIATLTVALVSVGCGTEGPPEARVSLENRDDLAVSSVDALARIVTSGNALDALSFLDPSAATVAASAGAASICKSGDVYESGSGLIFDECVIGELCVFDGGIEVSASSDGDRISINFIELDVLCAGLPLETLTNSFACAGLTGDSPSCSFSFGTFVGRASDRTLQIGDFELEEDDGDYELYAQILDSTHGYFTAETYGEPIQFDDCVGGVPEAGQLLIQGSGDESIFVEFFDCEEFSACFYEDDEDEEPICDNELQWSDYFPAEM